MMDPRLILALATIAAFTFSTSARAEGLYLAMSLGGSSYKADTSEADRDLVSAGATGLSSKLEKEDVAFKLQLGYKLNEHFAIEGGYVDLGNAKYSASFTGGSADIKVRAEGFNIAALGIVPIGEKFSLFGKVGVIYAYLSANASGGGIASGAGGSESSTKLKSHWSIGGDYALNNNWAVRAEFERFSDLGDKNSVGGVDVDLVSVGLICKF
ncbi:MAG: outer membrane beta-barrel protein [Rhodocyclaceae bacterium]|nr:outer membrane beta-barrel protein [Rhodocyclaceae bacterium]